VQIYNRVRASVCPRRLLTAQTSLVLPARDNSRVVPLLRGRPVTGLHSSGFCGAPQSGLVELVSSRLGSVSSPLPRFCRLASLLLFTCASLFSAFSAAGGAKAHGASAERSGVEGQTPCPFSCSVCWVRYRSLADSGAGRWRGGKNSAQRRRFSSTSIENCSGKRRPLRAGRGSRSPHIDTLVEE
jgi:hypothetical protein